MSRKLTRWLAAIEKVHYDETEVQQLVGKPLDPQIGYNEHNDGMNAEHRLNTLISTSELPKNPKEGEGYQVRDAYWVWSKGKWLNRNGPMGR